jgi:hypothetical protein
MKMIFRITAIVVIIISASHCLQTENKSFIPGLETISQKDLKKSVNFFSSPKLEGRLSGSEGYFKAAEYARDKFKSLGLQPAFGDNYFQPFNVEFNDIVSASFSLIGNGGINKNYSLGKDFICRGFTGSGDYKAEVVFCGYGISEPKLGYDDYKDVDVKNKIVLVFKQNPIWKINSKEWRNSYPRYKAKIAYEHGAKGILFVSRPNDKKPQKIIGSVLSGEGEQNQEFPQLHITLNTAEEILNGSGFSLNDLQSNIDSLQKPQSLVLKNSLHVKVESEYKKEKQTVNIGAILPGRDSVLKDEYLVIGAHLDHVGKQGKIYFPGANDNASGSAALLELAEAFVKGSLITSRSIIFILFSSEEAGLFGSNYFVNTYAKDLSSITAMINIDCIGYGDSIQVHNGKGAPVLWSRVQELDKKFTKMMIKTTWGGGGADATAFHKRGIPSIYFVTTNSYAHLHSLSDLPETLNWALFEKITKLIYLTAYDISLGKYKREVIVN